MVRKGFRTASESPVTFGEVGLAVPKAGVASDRLESLMESVGVDLPLLLSIGFIRVLQNVANGRDTGGA